MTEHWGYCKKTGRPHVPADIIKWVDGKLCKHCYKYFEEKK